MSDVPAIHHIRCVVQENILSDPARVTEASYLPYIAAGTVWVAETEIGLAGFVVLDRPASSVWALFVDPGMAGAGIGRALHDHLVDWAKDRGVPRLWLTTSKGTRAERFYIGAGWHQTGVAADGELRFEKSLLA